MIIWADFPSGQQGLYGDDEAAMLNGIYAQIIQESSASVSLVADPDPNIGSDGYVLKTSVATTSSIFTGGLRFALPTPAKTEGFGARLWLSNLPVNSNGCPFISFRKVDNSVIFAIRFLPNGSVEARSQDGDGGTLYGMSSGPVITANAYRHAEVKGFSDASAGTIEVKINGITVLDLDTLNTDGADIAQIVCGVRGGGDSTSAISAYWKDTVYWDTSGAEGNDFQGSVSVHDLLTDGDIALNWTPSTGSTGWDLLDESPANDADYIQAGDPAPDPAKFSLTNLPDDVTSVRALLPIVRAVKTDGGDCNIQVGLTPNDTNWDDGADRPITTAFTYWWDVSHLSPATSAPWTPVEVNAAYVRVDRTL